MDYAIVLENVTKRYKDFTLDSVSFTLPRGCIMGFIGENGAGKSTTIRLMLDLVRRDGGTISLLGEPDPAGRKEMRERIGVVLDESSFPENLSARQIGTVLGNIYSRWDGAQYRRYIERFSLPPAKSVKEYSRGMKMKLNIAAALSHNPELLILDEATSGLDPIVRDEILDVFLDFIQDDRHAVFMSSHIVSDLEKVCDYITFIHSGKLMFSRPKDELTDEFGILKCSAQDLRTVDASAVRGIRKNSFGVEALVEKNKIGPGHTVDRASIEDIMLFMVKGVN